MEIKVAYFLIVAIIGLAIALTVFSSGTQSRVEFEKQIVKPGFIKIEGTPTISAVGPQDCVKQSQSIGGDIWNCTYRPSISGLFVKSPNETSVAIAVSYKSQTEIVPCIQKKNGIGSVKQGPCMVDNLQSDGTYDAEFELSPVFQGVINVRKEYGDNPPTLNASSFTNLSKVWLIGGLRIILGNWTIDISSLANRLAIETALGLKEASIKVSCQNEVRLAGFNKDGGMDTVMCGKGVSVKLLSYVTMGGGCFDISVGNVSGVVSGDPIFISFWRYDQAFRDAGCGGLQSPVMTYHEPMPFDTTVALGTPDCASRFIGGYEFYAPVRAWTPLASGWQPVFGGTLCEQS